MCVYVLVCVFVCVCVCVCVHAREVNPEPKSCGEVKPTSAFPYVSILRLFGASKAGIFLCLCASKASKVSIPSSCHEVPAVTDIIFFPAESGAESPW